MVIEVRLVYLGLIDNLLSDLAISLGTLHFIILINVYNLLKVCYCILLMHFERSGASMLNCNLMPLRDYRSCHTLHVGIIMRYNIGMTLPIDLIVRMIYFCLRNLAPIAFSKLLFHHLIHNKLSFATYFFQGFFG